MAATYEPIATTTLGSAQANVEFTSISGFFTDLLLIMNLGNASSENTLIQFNSDTGSNYSFTFLSGDGSSASSGRSSNQTQIRVESNSAPGTGASSAIDLVYIMNYSNTTTNKTVLTRSNNAAAGTAATVGLWRNTNAITSIKIFGVSASNLVAGSTFTLYGIKAA